MKHARALAVTTAALTVAGTALGTALAVPGNAAQTMTFSGHPLNPDNQSFVDVNHNGQPDPGDAFVVADTLYNSSGKAVGYDRGTCTIIHVAGQNSGEVACHVIAAIPGGQLIFEGIQKIQNEFVEGAITGGSGDYAGRDGSARVTFPPNSNNSQITITLQ